MNRLLFYVHFNRENKLSQHVIYQLQALRPIYSKIVLISNSKLEGQLLTQLPFDDFLQRENKGFDFAAWSEGMRMIGFEDMRKFDSVTIMNDTTFGPIFDFEPIVNRMEKSDNDFWGITNNRSHQAEIGGHMHDLKTHIQSYFITFKQSVVSHPSFSTFWKNIQNYTDVNQVILKYETAVTDYFIQAGFKYDVQFDTVNSDISDMQNSDFSIFGLSHLLSHQIPFIKVKAFSHNAENSELTSIFDEIVSISDYPSQLIIEHMSLVDYPDRNYMLTQKILNLTNLNISKQRVGVHLHISDDSKLNQFLDALNQYLIDFDLFVTTSRNDIFQLMEHKAKEVIFVESNVRGILAWNEINNRLKDYDVVGHFQLVELEATINNLLKPAKKIVSYILENESIGLVISDSSKEILTRSMQEEDTWPYMAKIWNMIYPENEKNLKKQPVYVKSSSGGFWYKPEALSKVSSINLNSLLATNASEGWLIEQSVSNLLVYLTWANNYDFRILQVRTLTSFEKERNSRKQLMSVLEESSISYPRQAVIGRFLKKIIQAIKNMVLSLKNKGDI